MWRIISFRYCIGYQLGNNLIFIIAPLHGAINLKKFTIGQDSKAEENAQTVSENFALLTLMFLF